MTFKTMFLTFAWISLIGLGLTILTDFLMPILISIAICIMLVLILLPRRS